MSCKKPGQRQGVRFGRIEDLQRGAQRQRKDRRIHHVAVERKPCRRLGLNCSYVDGNVLGRIAVAHADDFFEAMVASNSS